MPYRGPLGELAGFHPAAEHNLTVKLILTQRPHGIFGQPVAAFQLSSSQRALDRQVAGNQLGDADALARRLPHLFGDIQQVLDGVVVRFVAVVYLTKRCQARFFVLFCLGPDPQGCFKAYADQTGGGGWLS